MRMWLRVSIVVALLGLASASVLSAGARRATAKPAGSVNVQILALNDFHGALLPAGSFATIPAGGVEYLATHVDQLRALNKNTVVVSAGDLIGASQLLSALFHDEPTIEAFNLIGLAFEAVGEHDLDEGIAELMRMQEGGCHPVDGCQDGDDFSGAGFRFLSANMVWSATGKTVFPAYKIRAFGGVRVAFVGVTLEDTLSLVSPSALNGLSFLDEADAVNALVPTLRKRGIEAIVVLLHEGGQQSGVPSPTTINGCTGFTGPAVDVAERLDDAVDAIISGHTHEAYSCEIDGKLVTSAGSSGHLLTKIDGTLDRATGDFSSLSANNGIVTRDVPKSPLLTALVTKYQVLAAPIANRVIGTITADLTRTPNSAGESALGDVAADAQLEATNDPGLGDAVVAFVSPGNLRADLVYNQLSGGEAPGEVTYAELFSVQPFAIPLASITLTGAQIETLLEQQFVGCGQPSNKILQVSSGFTYAWSASGAACDKVDPASILINGVVVDPAASYRVTVNSFLAEGGDRFSVLPLGTDRLGGPIDVDALATYFEQYSPVAPGPQNRITVVP